MSRDIVFVSHANPEDNEFTRWLTLKLAALGYRAWSDVTRLLGGEDFWEDIEGLIRERTVKFLFVLSRASNHKPGALQELHMAAGVERSQKLKDFLIPLRLDDIPHSDINIEVNRLNVIEFHPSWAKGLTQLGKKLAEDAVPRDARFGPAIVREWWQQTVDAEAGVTAEPEPHLSNWFRLCLPAQVFVHTLTRDTVGPIDPPDDLPYASVWQMPRLFTFASATDLEAPLGNRRIAHTDALDTARSIAGGTVSEQKANRDVITQLVARAWDMHLAARGLRAHEMSGGRLAFYFDEDSLPNENVSFVRADGSKAHRGLRGYKTVSKGVQYWHFALTVRPYLHPEPLLIVTSHVVFSDDNRHAWPSTDRMHKARRSQCKDWWNDIWRDRILATFYWLAEGDSAVALPVNSSPAGVVEARPIEFVSPVTLHEPSSEPEPDESDDDDEDDDDEEDGA